MNEDEIKGTARKAGGTVQEIAGKAVGNDNIEGKGYLNQAAGTLQDGYGKVREKVKDIVDEAAPAAREAIDTGRDYVRRGSAAIARTNGDNTALMLLAAGVAGAALGWFALTRKSAPEPKAPRKPAAARKTATRTRKTAQ